ncbi:MAG: hypothetical protein LBR06_04115 [Bacteroidales bacterium]|nr:hypothetical protein [Bacteroidales bacterium]
MFDMFNDDKNYPLEPVFKHAEESRDKGQLMWFTAHELTERGMKVKLEDKLFAMVNFNKMPWQYSDNHYWKVVFPHIVRRRMNCKVISADRITNEFGRPMFRIHADASVQRLPQPKLVEGEEYNAIILHKSKSGFIVDAGYHFEWAHGGVTGLLPFINFPDMDAFKDYTVGQEIKVTFVERRDKELIFAQKGSTLKRPVTFEIVDINKRIIDSKAGENPKNIYYTFSVLTDEGISAVVPSRLMPWQYASFRNWAAVFHYLKGHKFSGEISDIALYDDNTEVIIDATKHPLSHVELVPDTRYTAIVIRKIDDGLIVDAGSHFDWECGPITGFLGRTKFIDVETFNNTVEGQTVEVFCTGYNDKGAVLAEAEYFELYSRYVGKTCDITMTKQGKNISFSFKDYKASIPRLKLPRYMHYPDGVRTISCRIMDYMPDKGFVIRHPNEVQYVDWNSRETKSLVGKEVTAYSIRSETDNQLKFIVEGQYPAIFPKYGKLGLEEGCVIKCLVSQIDYSAHHFRLAPPVYFIEPELPPILLTEQDINNGHDFYRPGQKIRIRIYKSDKPDNNFSLYTTDYQNVTMVDEYEFDELRERDNGETVECNVIAYDRKTGDVKVRLVDNWQDTVQTRPRPQHIPVVTPRVELKVIGQTDVPTERKVIIRKKTDNDEAELPSPQPVAKSEDSISVSEYVSQHLSAPKVVGKIDLETLNQRIKTAKRTKEEKAELRKQLAKNKEVIKNTAIAPAPEPATPTPEPLPVIPTPEPLPTPVRSITPEPRPVAAEKPATVKVKIVKRGAKFTLKTVDNQPVKLYKRKGIRELRLLNNKDTVVCNIVSYNEGDGYSVSLPDGWENTVNAPDPVPDPVVPEATGPQTSGVIRVKIINRKTKFELVTLDNKPVKLYKRKGIIELRKLKGGNVIECNIVSYEAETDSYSVSLTDNWKDTLVQKLRTAKTPLSQAPTSAIAPEELPTEEAEVAAEVTELEAEEVAEIEAELEAEEVAEIAEEAEEIAEEPVAEKPQPTLEPVQKLKTVRVKVARYDKIVHIKTLDNRSVSLYKRKGIQELRRLNDGDTLECEEVGVDSDGTLIVQLPENWARYVNVSRPPTPVFVPPLAEIPEQPDEPEETSDTGIDAIRRAKMLVQRLSTEPAEEPATESGIEPNSKHVLVQIRKFGDSIELVSIDNQVVNLSRQSDLRQLQKLNDGDIIPCKIISHDDEDGYVVRLLNKWERNITRAHYQPAPVAPAPAPVSVPAPTPAPPESTLTYVRNGLRVRIVDTENAFYLVTESGAEKVKLYNRKGIRDLRQLNNDDIVLCEIVSHDDETGYVVRLPDDWTPNDVNPPLPGNVSSSAILEPGAPIKIRVLNENGFELITLDNKPVKLYKRKGVKELRLKPDGAVVTCKVVSHDPESGYSVCLPQNWEAPEPPAAPQNTPTSETKEEPAFDDLETGMKIWIKIVKPNPENDSDFELETEDGRKVLLYRRKGYKILSTRHDGEIIRFQVFKVDHNGCYVQLTYKDDGSLLFRRITINKDTEDTAKNTDEEYDSDEYEGEPDATDTDIPAPLVLKEKKKKPWSPPHIDIDLPVIKGPKIIGKIDLSKIPDKNKKTNAHKEKENEIDDDADYFEAIEETDPDAIATAMPEQEITVAEPEVETTERVPSAISESVADAEPVTEAELVAEITEAIEVTEAAVTAEAIEVPKTADAIEVIESAGIADTVEVIADAAEAPHESTAATVAATEEAASAKPVEVQPVQPQLRHKTITIKHIKHDRPALPTEEDMPVVEPTVGGIDWAAKELDAYISKEVDVSVLIDENKLQLLAENQYPAILLEAQMPKWDNGDIVRCKVLFIDRAHHSFMLRLVQPLSIRKADKTQPAPAKKAAPPKIDVPAPKIETSSAPEKLTVSTPGSAPKSDISNTPKSVIKIKPKSEVKPKPKSPTAATPTKRPRPTAGGTKEQPRRKPHPLANIAYDKDVVDIDDIKDEVFPIITEEEQDDDLNWEPFDPEKEKLVEAAERTAIEGTTAMPEETKTDSGEKGFRKILGKLFGNK